MSAKKKIVFFTKSFNRTGSEILLLQLINNLDPAFEAEFFSLYKGELYDELDPKVKKDYLLKSTKRETFFERLRAKWAFGYVLPWKLSARKKSVWYVNTIVLPGILNYAREKSIKTILHCHELEPMFGILNDTQKKIAIHFPSLIIANSNASAAIFKKNERKKAVEISYPFVDPAQYKFDLVKYNSVRSELGIKADEFVWLMCGTMDKNKNPELFIELAQRFVNEKYVKFIWLGNNYDNPVYESQLINSTKGLTNLTWVNKRSAAYKDYLNACNAFVLTSQFESFSMVTIEALAAGKPVVVNNCVGVNEILRNDIGKIIAPKNDVNQFVTEMKRVMEGKAPSSIEMGIERALEFNKKYAIEKWNKLLKDHLE